MDKAYLLLADGTLYEGRSFGAKGTVLAETVFTTGMTAYQETLTDPSYFGQIVTQTFPLIGNYGINSFDGESDRCYLSGYIVREWCEQPSNFRSERDIDSFLKEQGVVGICGIDTRNLTRRLREHGVMNAILTTAPIADQENALKEIRAFTIKDAVKSVSRRDIKRFAAENGKYEVLLFDFGCKNNIRNELLRHGCNVTVVPYDTTPEEVRKLNPDGIMLSNGPGDPAENVEIIENLKEIMKFRIPIFGICIGHQLLALANGAAVTKLKYGHHGANQPVIDVEKQRTYVTSQNHNYAVDGDTLDPAVGKVSHINANDGTCEGIAYHNMPMFTTQFHPEARGGPQDTEYLFGTFINMMNNREVK